MLYTMFHGKIHRAVVTQARLDYMGSITIDEDLLDAAGILPGEKVQIVNNNNGERLETYTIAGERGSGVICLNGAAARKAQVGDVVIIIAYGLMDAKEAKLPEYCHVTNTAAVLLRYGCCFFTRVSLF